MKQLKAASENKVWVHVNHDIQLLGVMRAWPQKPSDYDLPDTLAAHTDYEIPFVLFEALKANLHPAGGAEQAMEFVVEDV